MCTLLWYNVIRRVSSVSVCSCGTGTGAHLSVFAVSVYLHTPVHMNRSVYGTHATATVAI